MLADGVSSRRFDSSANFLISSISVVGLFGRYNYRVELPGEAAPRLILLYADNGRGKSTLLRILWHLLAPASFHGHRSALLRIPFSEVRIELGRGDTIIAKREDELIGPYTVTVKRGRRVRFSESYPSKNKLSQAFEYLDSESVELYRKVASGHPNDDEYTDYLSGLGILPFYLSDDRRVHDDNLKEVRSTRAMRGREERRRGSDDEEKVPLQVELEFALERVNNWIRSQVFSAQNAGSSSADEIYAEVLSQLARRKISSEDPEPGGIYNRIVELGALTSRYAEFGLMPQADSRKMLSSIEKMSASALRQAEAVLEPYLDGQFSKLYNLESAERVTRTLVNRLNEFLVEKQVSYHVRTGLRIATDDGVPLPPTSLSSGERQLILLFCNAVVARDATGLFIIDEPELSLNSKWQRRLVQALLDCVEGSDVQFIMATHSIEIVTRHRQYLVQLGEV